MISEKHSNNLSELLGDLSPSLDSILGGEDDDDDELFVTATNKKEGTSPFLSQLTEMVTKEEKISMDVEEIVTKMSPFKVNHPSGVTTPEKKTQIGSKIKYGVDMNKISTLEDRLKQMEMKLKDSEDSLLHEIRVTSSTPATKQIQSASSQQFNRNGVSLLSGGSFQDSSVSSIQEDLQKAKDELKALSKQYESMNELNETSDQLRNELEALRKEHSQKCEEYERRIHDLEVQIKRLTELKENITKGNVKKLDSMVSEIQSDRKSFENKIQQLEKQNENLTIENENLRGTLSTLTKEANEKIYKLQNLNQEETRNMRKELSDLKEYSKSLEKVKEKMEEAQKKSEIYCGRNAELGKTNQLLSEEVNKLKSEISDLQHQVKELEHYSSSIEKSNSELEAKSKIFQGQLREFEESSKRFHLEQKKMLEMMEHEAQVNERKIEQLQNQFEEKEKELNSLLKAEKVENEILQKQVRDLNGKSSVLSLEKQMLKEESTIIKEQNKELKHAASRANEKIQILISEQNSAKYEISQYKDSLERLKQEASHAKNTKINAEAKLKLLDEQNSNFKIELETHQKQISLLNERLNSLNEQLSEYKSKDHLYEQQHHDIDLYKKRTEELISEKESLEKQLNIADEQIEKLAVELKVAMSKQIEYTERNVKSPSIHKKISMEQDAEKTQYEMEQLKQDICERDKEKERLQSRIKYLERERERMEKKVKEMSTKLKDASAKNRQLFEKSLQFEAKELHMHELRAKIKQLTEEKENLRKTICELESSHKGNTKQIHSMSQEMEKAANTINELYTTIKELEKKCAEWEQQVLKRKKEIDFLRVQNTLLTQQKEQLNTELSTSKDTNKQLREELTKSKSMLDVIKKDVEQYKQQSMIEGLNESQRIQKLKDDLQGARNERNELRKKLTHLEGANYALIEEKQDFESKIKSLESETESLQKAYSQVQDQLSSAEGRNKHLKLKVVQLSNTEKLYKELEQHKRLLEEEVQKLEHDNHDLSVALTVKSNELTTISQSKDTLEASAIRKQLQLERKNEMIVNELKSMRDDRDDIEREKKETELRLESLVAEKTNLLEKLMAAEKQRDELLKFAASEREKLNHSLSEQVEITQNQTADLTQEVEMMRNQIKTLTEERDQNLKSRREIEYKVREANGEREKLLLELKLSKRKIDELQQDVESYVSKIKKNEHTIQEIITSNNTKQHQYNSVINENGILQKKVQDLHSDLDALKKVQSHEREMKEGSIEDLESRLENCYSQIHCTQKEKKRLRQLIDDLSNNLSSCEIQQQQMEDDKLHSEDQQKDLERELEVAETRIRELTMDKEILVSELSNKIQQHKHYLENIKQMTYTSMESEEVQRKLEDENYRLRSMVHVIKKLEDGEKWDEINKEQEIKTLKNELNFVRDQLNQSQEELEQERVKREKSQTMEDSVSPSGENKSFQTDWLSSKNVIQELNEVNRSLREQIDKLHDKIRSKEMSVLLMEKSWNHEKLRLQANNKAVINQYQSEIKITTNAIDMLKEKNKLLLNVVAKEQENMEQYINEVETQISPKLTSTCSMDVQDSDSLKTISDQIKSHGSEISHHLSVIRKVVEEEQGLIDLLRRAQSNVTLLENEIDILVLQKKSTQHKIFVNESKHQHLKLVHKQLCDPLLDNIFQLEELGKDIEFKSQGSNYENEETMRMIKQFEFHIQTLEFRIQYLHKSEKLEKSMYNRIVKLEKLKTSLLGKLDRPSHSYSSEKHFKTERFNQYIGEMLADKSMGDKEQFMVNLQQIIDELEKRIEILRHSEAETSKKIHSSESKLQEHRENERKTSTDLNRLDGKLLLEYQHMCQRITHISKLSKQRNNLLENLSLNSDPVGVMNVSSSHETKHIKQIESLKETCEKYETEKRSVEKDLLQLKSKLLAYASRNEKLTSEVKQIKKSIREAQSTVQELEKQSQIIAGKKEKQNLGDALGILLQTIDKELHSTMKEEKNTK